MKETVSIAIPTQKTILKYRRRSEMLNPTSRFVIRLSTPPYQSPYRPPP